MRFRLRRWAACAAGLLMLVGGGCAYLDTKQGEWIFRPTDAVWRGYDANSNAFENVEIAVPESAGGGVVHAWWSPAANNSISAPVLLYLHGARWNLSGSSSRIPRWNRMGFSVLAIDYRGFGRSSRPPDGVPSEQSAAADVRAAWVYLQERSPGARKFIFGHSLGAALAIGLALEVDNAEGLILEGAFTSIPDMVKTYRYGWLPVDWLITQRFDNLSRISSVRIPIVFAHGTADAVVPFQMSEKLYAQAKAPKRFLRAEGGSHHNLSFAFFDDYQQALQAHFRLGTPPTASGRGG